MKISKVLKDILCGLVVIFIITGPYLFETYKSNLEKTPENEKATYKGVITLWDYPYFNKDNGTRYGWITKKIKEFEKENKGVYIDFKPLSYENGLIEIETSAKINALPDIAPVGANVEIQQLDLLQPLNDYIENNILNEYFDDVINSVTYNNHIYGIPKLINLHVMLLNKNEFEAKGIQMPQKPVMPQNDFLSLIKQSYNQTGKSLSLDKKTMISMAWHINNQEKLQEIKTNSGMIYYKNIINELEKQKISIGTCQTMDLAKINDTLAGELNYKWMNFYAQEKDIYGECLAYGIFKQKDQKKLEMCLKFVDFLTNNKEQLQLNKFNAFSVKKLNEPLYIEESGMGQLEKILKKANKRFTNTLTRDEKSDFINMYLFNDKS